MRKKKYFVITCCILLCLLLSFAYGTNTNSWGGNSLYDFSYTSLKIMSALFFEWEEKLYVIGGTEVAAGIYNHSANSVFVYCISSDQLIIYEKLDDSISITSFCDAGNDIYFGTISSDTTTGTTLYRYSKSVSKLSECCHFDKGKGIYDIGISTESPERIVVTVSEPLGVYIYDVLNGNSCEISSDFLEERFIRSVSAVENNIYLGLGSRADFIKMDADTGELVSILPLNYQSDAFVYDQYVRNENVYLLLSPSYDVIVYDTDTENFKKVCFYNPENRYEALNLADSCDEINLLGNIFFIDKDTDVVKGSVQGGNIVSYVYKNLLYGIDSSGILRIYDNQGQKGVVDLYIDVNREYSVPQKYIIYDDCIYIPGRRFVKIDMRDDTEKVFLVGDEPQALYCDGEGIYTANYTECTIYYYPWDVFEEDSYSVDMNEEKYLLADISNQCRPFDIDKSLDGKYLFLASGPLYGKFGGGLSVYDLNQDFLLYTEIDIVPKQRITDICISSYENCIWLASDTYGENTSPSRFDENPHLILYDYINKKIMKDIELNREDIGAGSVIEQDGFLYCRNHYGNMIIYRLSDDNCIYRDADNWRSLDLIQNKVVANNGHEIFRVNRSGEKNVICDGFENLTGVTEDKSSGFVYGFENTRLTRIEGF